MFFKYGILLGLILFIPATALFLINAGIDSNKIIIVEGKGKYELFTTKTDSEARSKNRRVIIYAIKTEKITPKVEEEKPKEKPVEKPENKTKNLTEEIQDTTTKVGDNLILRNINFYGGRHIFLRQSFSGRYAFTYFSASPIFIGLPANSVDMVFGFIG